MTEGFCNGKCETCPIILGENSRALYAVLGIVKNLCNLVSKEYKQIAIRVLSDPIPICPPLTGCLECTLSGCCPVPGCPIDQLKNKNNIGEKE